MLPFGKILCPVDFSEPSYEALQAADELARHFAAELSILHVVSLVPTLSPSIASPRAFDVAKYQEELEDSSKQALKDLIKDKISKELAVRPLLLVGDAATEIVRVAEEENADLIMIATHGRSGWRRVIFGSVAEKVVRFAPCPVLTIRSTLDINE